MASGGGTDSETDALVIEARGLGFSHRGTGTRQLADITCDIPAGSRVAVMGAAGAGTSTFAMTLNGLVPHHHPGDLYGQLRVAGIATHETTPPHLVRVVGLVSQNPEAQVMERMVIDDVATGPANLGLGRDEVLSRAQRALEEVGLAGLADRETATLSGGQLQRLAIAGVLAMEPQILVLDEPTSALDPEGAATVQRIVADLSAAGRTVVMVDHDPDAVATWADLLLVLEEGKLAYFGAPGPFLDDERRVAAAGIRPRHRCRGGVPERPEPETPPVLEAIDLTHRYPSGVLALDGVGVTIHRGEFVALLGGNGAGKTTLAKHFAGLLEPTSGTLRSHAGRVGFVFQNPDHQIFANTVLDEAAFGPRNAELPDPKVAERAGRALKRVGLGDVAGLHPLRLGRGDRQRLAVASALAMNPDVLILDEPTTGLDWRGAKALMELLTDLNRDGTTIVMITHDLPLAAHHASRTVTLPAPVPEIAPEDPGNATARGNVLDVRSKLMALTAVVAATFLASAPLANLGLATLTAGALMRVRGMRGLWGLLAPMLPVLALVFGFAAIAPGGIGYASTLVLRLVTMLCSTAALLATTPAERFTTLMRTLRLPNPLVFVCTTALRFIPTLRRRSRQITEAQRVRGAHIDSRGPVRRVLAHATIMVPLLTSGIRMSEDLAAAMISRGYGITRHPTRLHDLHWTWRDTLLALVSAALPFLAVAAG